MCVVVVAPPTMRLFAPDTFRCSSVGLCTECSVDSPYALALRTDHVSDETPPRRYWAARMAAEAAAAEQQRQMLAEADAAEAEVLAVRSDSSTSHSSVAEYRQHVSPSEPRCVLDAVLHPGVMPDRSHHDPSMRYGDKPCM